MPDADKGDYVEEEGHLAPPPQLDGGGAVVDSEELHAGAQDERAAAATEAARLADGAKQAAQEAALLEAREERDRLAAVASPLDEAKRSLEAARRKRDALYSQLESAEVHLATVTAARNAAERKLDRLAEREGRQRQVSPVRSAPPVSFGQAPSASDAKAMRDSLKRVKEEIRAMELRLPAHEEARFHVEKLQNERRGATMRAAALKAEIRRLLDETTRERGVLAALEAGAAPTDTERRDNAEVVRLKTAIAAENAARALAERDAAATARKLRVVHTALAGFFTAHRLSSANCTKEEHGAALAEYVAACSSTVHETEKRVGFLEGKAERLQQLYDEAAGELTKVVHARTRRAMRRRRPLPALEPGVERAVPEELPAAPPPEPILERQRPWRAGTKPRSAATAPSRSPRLAKAAPKQAPKQARSPVRGSRRSGRKLEERAANVPTDRGASNSAPAPKPFFGLAAAETKATEAAEPTQATVAQVAETVEEEGAMADIDVTQAVGAMEYRGEASVARQGSDERTGAMAEQVAQDASTHHEPADLVGRGDAADMQEETAVAAVETSSKAELETESEVEAVETLMPVLMPAEATEPSQGFTNETQAEGEKGTETDEKREEDEDRATRLSTTPSPAQPEPSEATGKASKERETDAEAEAEADMEAEVAVVEAEAEAEVLAVVDVEAEAEEESKAEAGQEAEQEGEGEAEVEADAKAGSEIEQDVSTTAVTAAADTLEGERVTVGQAEDGAVEDTTVDKVEGKEAKADEVEGSTTPTWEAEVEGGAAAKGEAAAGRVEASDEAAGETAAPAAAPPPSDDLGVDDALQLPSSDDE